MAPHAATALALSTLLLLTPVAAEAGVVRQDRFIDLPGGGRLFAREVRPAVGATAAVILVHGARVPGIGSFDLPVASGSLATDLAAAGHAVYAIDLQGYGRSTRPAAMDEAPNKSPPLIRTEDAVSDIAHAVAAISAWTGDRKISLLGWAAGGHWAGAYASANPDRVEKLIFYNSLYGGTAEHRSLGRGSPIEDPQKPGTFNAASSADTG